LVLERKRKKLKRHRRGTDGKRNLRRKNGYMSVKTHFTTGCESN